MSFVSSLTIQYIMSIVFTEEVFYPYFYYFYKSLSMILFFAYIEKIIILRIYPISFAHSISSSFISFCNALFSSFIQFSQSVNEFPVRERVNVYVLTGFFRLDKTSQLSQTLLLLQSIIQFHLSQQFQLTFRPL